MLNVLEDLLKREDFINDHSGDLEQLLTSGGSIGFTAPFGGGKTWLCDRFVEKINNPEISPLKKKNIKAVKIDASLYQYSNEPFIPIASALIKSMKGTKTTLKTKTKKLVKEIIPLGLSALLKVDIKPIIDILTDESLSVEDAINEYKKALSKLAKQQPVIFFIDELDRCNPEFALKFLDRIYHYFTIPNICFVISFNEEQIHKYIKIALGDDNGANYLEKYLSHLISIPNPSSRKAQYVNLHKLHSFYVHHLGQEKYEESFLKMAFSLSKALNITNLNITNLRNHKRVIEDAKKFKERKGKEQLNFVDAYVAFLKIRSCHLFDDFTQGDQKLFWQKEANLIDLVSKDDPWACEMLKSLEGAIFGNKAEFEVEKILGVKWLICSGEQIPSFYSSM